MKFHNRIYFSNEQHDFLIKKETKELIKKAIDATLAYEKFPKPAEVSVTFTDNEQIREINREYRGKDTATDVLSFPIISDDDPDGDFDIQSGCVVIGDIVISVERALEQAITYGHSAERELAFLAVHSTLHLLGYDHERSAEEDELMQKKQEEVLGMIGQPRKTAK